MASPSGPFAAKIECSLVVAAPGGARELTRKSSLLPDRRWLLRAALCALFAVIAGTTIALNGSSPPAQVAAREVAGHPRSGGLRPDGATLEQQRLERLRAAEKAAEIKLARQAAAARRARHAVAVRQARHTAVLRHARQRAGARVARLSRAVHRLRTHAVHCARRHHHRGCHTTRHRHRLKAARRDLRHARHLARRARQALVAYHRSAHRQAVQLRATQHRAARRQAHRAAAIRRAERAARRAYEFATFRRARRSMPGQAVLGHYIRSLTGRARDLRIMRRLGAADARRNRGGAAHLVLLDIGGQGRHGVFLSIVDRFVSYPALVRALNSYVAGYHSRQHRHAPVTISLGTNNDLYTSANAGRLWARKVVNPVRATARRYPDLTVAGANDIEPGFSAGPRATKRWLHGYLRNTAAPFVFNGSADGCSWTRPASHCNRGWSARTLAVLAGGAAPRRTFVLPQIYNRLMAGQWAQISRTAARTRHTRLHIVGPLTEQRACGRNPSCPSMPSRAAWQLLHHKLRSVGLLPPALPVRVDLDVH